MIANQRDARQRRYLHKSTLLFGNRCSHFSTRQPSSRSSCDLCSQSDELESPRQRDIKGYEEISRDIKRERERETHAVACKTPSQLFGRAEVSKRLASLASQAGQRACSLVRLFGCSAVRLFACSPGQLSGFSCGRRRVARVRRAGRKAQEHRTGGLKHETIERLNYFRDSIKSLARSRWLRFVDARLARARCAT